MTLMTRLGSLSVDLGIASPVTIGAVLGAGVLFYIIRLSFGNDSNSNACRNPKNHLGKCQPKRQSEQSTCLPQNAGSCEALERNVELQLAQKRYEYTFSETPKNLPFVKGLPNTEIPAVEWMIKLIGLLIDTNIGNFRAKFGFGEIFSALGNEMDAERLFDHIKEGLGIDPDAADVKASSIQDYIGQIKKPYPSRSKYRSIVDWENDNTFARYRLGPGPHPDAIFKMTAEVRGKIKALDSSPDLKALKKMVDELINKGELFVTDFTAFQGVPGKVTQGAQKYVCAPIALFRINPDKSARERQPLMPLGIMLEEGGAIFTPEDRQSWMIARACYNSADATYHEAISHLAETHLVIEAFIPATRRQLPSQHPLNRLLLPHFEGSAFINFGASRFLINPNGGVDTLTAPPIEITWNLVREKVLAKLSKDFSFPTEIESREMDVKNFPYMYPYRDDSMMLWDAIYKFVGNYLQLYYGTDATTQAKGISEDNELKNWVAELISDDGGNVGWLKDDWEAEKNKYGLLVKVVSTIIFTASVQHAAVNFPQLPVMAYSPAYQLSQYHETPSTTLGAKTKDIFKYLPPLELAEKQLQLLTLLGGLQHTTLGHYNHNAFTDVKVQDIVDLFRADLSDIKAKIEHRNTTLIRLWSGHVPDNEATNVVYTTLLPDKIPQSINI
eukprot:56733_1